MLEGPWLTFPCSTKEKNLSTSLLKTVIFISPCGSKNTVKQNIPTWRHACTHKQVRWPLDCNTHTFIYYLKGEKLSFSSWITPVADTGLVHDSGSDGPSRGEDTSDKNFASQNKVAEPWISAQGGQSCLTNFHVAKTKLQSAISIINTRIIV